MTKFESISNIMRNITKFYVFRKKMSQIERKLEVSVAKRRRILCMCKVLEMVEGSFFLFFQVHKKMRELQSSS